MTDTCTCINPSRPGITCTPNTAHPACRHLPSLCRQVRDPANLTGLCNDEQPPWGLAPPPATLPAAPARTMYCCARKASCLVRWMRSCCCCMASRCFCTYCFTGVHTGHAGFWHFWWCFSSSRLVTHLRARPRQLVQKLPRSECLAPMVEQPECSSHDWVVLLLPGARSAHTCPDLVSAKHGVATTDHSTAGLGGTLRCTHSGNAQLKVNLGGGPLQSSACEQVGPVRTAGTRRPGRRS